MFTDLALAGVAVVEPLEEAVLVDELDAAAACAGVAQRVLVVAAVAADPADVPVLLVVLVVVSGGRGGERPRLLLLLRLARGSRGRVEDLRHGCVGDRGGGGEADREEGERERPGGTSTV